MQPVTRQAALTDHLYNVFMVFAIIVFVIVVGLIGWSLLRYRNRTDDLPKQTHGNKYLETTWTILPILLVIYLFVYTYRVETVITKNPTPKVTIDVLAFQWGWRFTYQNTPVIIEGDTVHQPHMEVPVGEAVRFVLNSPDVIHSFYVPPFLYKLQAIPGITNTFTVTVNKTGKWDARCATFCGTEHANMGFTMRAVPPAQFAAWLKSHATAGTSTQAILPS